MVIGRRLDNQESTQRRRRMRADARVYHHSPARPISTVRRFYMHARIGKMVAVVAQMGKPARPAHLEHARNFTPTLL